MKYLILILLAVALLWIASIAWASRRKPPCDSGDGGGSGDSGGGFLSSNCDSNNGDSGCGGGDGGGGDGGGGD